MISQTKINPFNFGEYLACLGAAEVARQSGHRVRLGFKKRSQIATDFLLETDGDMDWSVLNPTPIQISDQRRGNIPLDAKTKNYGSVVLSLPCGAIELDWWFDDFLTKPIHCPFSGFPVENKVREILGEIKKSAFDYYDLSTIMGLRVKNGTNMYFDRRDISYALRSKLGFSPDMAGVKIDSHPFVELLALIGGQSFRFRRNLKKGGDTATRYYVWESMLPFNEAMLAVFSPWDSLPGEKLFTTKVSPESAKGSYLYYEWSLTEQEFLR